MAQPFDMCSALDMPCGARGDFDPIESQSDLSNFRQEIYRFCLSKHIDKGCPEEIVPSYGQLSILPHRFLNVP